MMTNTSRSLWGDKNLFESGVPTPRIAPTWEALSTGRIALSGGTPHRGAWRIDKGGDTTQVRASKIKPDFKIYWKRTLKCTGKGIRYFGAISIIETHKLLK